MIFNLFLAIDQLIMFDRFILAGYPNFGKRVVKSVKCGCGTLLLGLDESKKAQLKDAKTTKTIMVNN